MSQANGLLMLKGGGLTALPLAVYDTNWMLREPIQLTNSTERCPTGGKGKEGLG